MSSEESNEGRAEGKARRQAGPPIAFTSGPDPIAYVPGEVIVAGRHGLEAVREHFGSSAEVVETSEVESQSGVAVFALMRLAEGVDLFALIDDLALEGVVAQPNHVLFAHDGCSCGGGCCPPHPAACWSSSPCGCGPSGAIAASPLAASPLYASPLYASPLYASPLYASPAAALHHKSSAVPAPAPAGPHRVAPAGAPRPRVVVLDTGLAADGLRPLSLDSVEHPVPGWEETTAVEPDGSLDPAAGHGTFICGLIDSLAPGCDLVAERVLSPEGAGQEFAIAMRIAALSGVDILNLSFGGYTLTHMHMLAAAIRKVQKQGTVVVSSAGNDGTCRKTFPAAFPGVVSVGAVGPNGPAPFSNYGEWVRACAPGVNLVSTFFTYFQGPEPAPPGYPEPDEFQGWASWCGTSFAGPVVASALAREIQNGFTAAEAVERVIDAPGLLRIPNLGTVVNLQ